MTLLKIEYLIKKILIVQESSHTSFKNLILKMSLAMDTSFAIILE